MESSIPTPSLKSFDNSRRVLRSLKKFTDSTNTSYFLTSHSLYGGSQMDGKFSIFQSDYFLPDNIKSLSTLSPFHFVETSYGVEDSEYFSFENGVEYIAAGLNDGSVHLYNYSDNKGKNYEKPIFKLEK
jgi:hypothetical protein